MYELLVFICSAVSVFGALVMLGSVDASDAGFAFGSILSFAAAVVGSVAGGLGWRRSESWRGWKLAGTIFVLTLLALWLLLIVFLVAT